MFSLSPTNSESTTRDVYAERPLLPDACVKPMPLSAIFRFLYRCISPRAQMPLLRFL